MAHGSPGLFEVIEYSTACAQQTTHQPVRECPLRKEHPRASWLYAREVAAIAFFLIIMTCRDRHEPVSGSHPPFFGSRSRAPCHLWKLAMFSGAVVQENGTELITASRSVKRTGGHWPLRRTVPGRTISEMVMAGGFRLIKNFLYFDFFHS